MLLFFWFSSLFWSVQLVGAWLYRRRASVGCSKGGRVSVVVPAYNEDLWALHKCVRAALDCPEVVRVVVVDDWSDQPVSLSIGDTRLSVVRQPQNLGKRQALLTGFSLCETEWVACVDSDTEVEPTAFSELFNTQAHTGASAVTGNVRLSNRRQNLLTRMIEPLYWFSFEQERCLQSLAGSVCCLSGALYIVRRDLVMQAGREFVDQQVFGRPARSGDDRHLASLVLLGGGRTAVAYKALAWTNTPHTIRAFTKQQVRWVRSYVRELFWLRPRWAELPSMYSYVVLTDAYRYIYIVGVYLAAPWYLLQGSAGAWALGVAAVAALHGLVAVLYTGRPRYIIYSVGFAFYSLIFLAPALLYGVCTAGTDRWMSRESGDPPIKK